MAAAKIISGEEELPGEDHSGEQSSVDAAYREQTISDERKEWEEIVEEGGARSDSEEEVVRVVAAKYEEFERTCGELLDPGEEWWQV